MVQPVLNPRALSQTSKYTKFLKGVNVLFHRSYFANRKPELKVGINLFMKKRALKSAFSKQIMLILFIFKTHTKVTSILL